VSVPVAEDDGVAGRKPPRQPAQHAPAVKTWSHPSLAVGTVAGTVALS